LPSPANVKIYLYKIVILTRCFVGGVRLGLSQWENDFGYLKELHCVPTCSINVSQHFSGRDTEQCWDTFMLQVGKQWSSLRYPKSFSHWDRPSLTVCNACWLLDKTGCRIRRFFSGTPARAAPIVICRVRFNFIVSKSLDWRAGNPEGSFWMKTWHCSVFLCALLLSVTLLTYPITSLDRSLGLQEFEAPRIFRHSVRLLALLTGRVTPGDTSHFC